MIDFHCHLDLYASPIEVIEEAAKRNIFTLAVTTSPKAWIATGRVLQPYSTIQVALGLHPEIVTQKASEKDLLIKSIGETQFIGEIGLDGSKRFKNSFGLQIDIFESAIKECSRQGGKVISIHSRAAEKEVLDILASNPGAGVPVLHWYSGSKINLERALELGCWFSVGPAMIRSESGRRITKAIPLGRLLPESDGPFARDGDVPIWPWQASKISQMICEFWSSTPSEVESCFKKNLQQLIGR